MKKITFLLTLLGVSASSVFAGVLTPSTDSESHLFAIKNPNNNYYCTVNGEGIGSTENKAAVAFFKATAGSETGKYYLFCTTNNKYVTYSDATSEGAGKVTFTDNKEDAKQWKINLESNQTERYDIYPEDVNGGTTDLSWNWYGGAGYNMGFYRANDGNSTWTFENDVVENATFTFLFNGTTVTTKTSSALVGSTDVPTSGLNFVSNTSMEPATIAAGTTAYTVTLAEALPFTKSTSFNDATWYIMDMHSNDSGTPDVLSGEKNYTWTYAAADEDVTLPKQVMSEATYSDNMLWCFIGDVINGFKIYNKAAGSSLTLRKATTGNTAAVMSATNDHNQFKLYPTTENIANGFCLKLDGDDYYVNTQAVNNVKVLRGYDKSDGGSTCRVFAPNKFVVSAAQSYNNNYKKSSELPTGTLGANSYLEEGDNLANFKAAYAAANTSTATIEQINALSAYNKSINAADKGATTIEVGKYYRLYSKSYNKYMRLNTNPANALTTIVTDANAGKDAASVVWFTNAESGRYRMMMEGYTFGKATTSANVKLVGSSSNEKGSYEVTCTARAFTFRDKASNTSRYNLLHAANSGDNIVGWEEADASDWYVIPATDVEIGLNAVGSSAYASAYLPFSVSAVEGAEAYVGTLSNDQSALDMTKVEGVPANNGFVLVGTGDKATLTIGTAAAVTNNSLTGTNTGITLADDTRANYLVFGKNADVVGFYTPSTSVTKIGANKAYLDATALTGADAIAMNFGGTTTAINTAIVNNQGVNAPVYDLSGRRVVAPVKGGVYIQNGKKFIK